MKEETLLTCCEASVELSRVFFKLRIHFPKDKVMGTFGSKVTWTFNPSGVISSLAYVQVNKQQRGK